MIVLPTHISIVNICGYCCSELDHEAKIVLKVILDTSLRLNRKSLKPSNFK